MDKALDNAVTVLIACLTLVSKDMHTVSSRPCETCRKISDVLEAPFGCYAYQEKRRKKD